MHDDFQTNNKSTQNLSCINEITLDTIQLNNSRPSHVIEKSDGNKIRLSHMCSVKANASHKLDMQ